MYKTFGELSRAEQVALFEAWLDGKQIQVIILNDQGQRWSNTNPVWNKTSIYRIATIPDTVRWEMIDPEYKWYARSENGNAFVYMENPELCGRYMLLMKRAYTNNGCDWKDSLQERPESA